MSAVPDASIDELYRRIGRNLLRFQQIELWLKGSLPYVHPEGSKSGILALKKYQSALKLKTLAPLVSAMSESVDATPGFFTLELQKIVDARNALVHHLFQLPGIDYMKPDATNRVLEYLDSQFKDAEELFEFARELSACTLLAIAESNPERYPELNSHYEQLEQLLSPLTRFERCEEPNRS